MVLFEFNMGLLFWAFLLDWKLRFAFGFHMGLLFG